MKDPRNEILAKQLVDYSTKLQAGETLYLEMRGKETLEIGKQVIRIATERGATVVWYYNDESLLRQFLKVANEDQMRRQAELHLEWMRRADAYIGIRGSDNPYDLSDIDGKQKDAYNKVFVHPVHMEERVKRTRWVVLRFPNNAMAQLAEAAQETFEDFYYQVCCANYAKMSEAEDMLAARLRAASDVRIVAPGTDLSFSIKGVPVVNCDGHRNIPDGEVYTAPVRDSVNGVIKYNTPSLYEGTVFTGITLTFKDGKIINAVADSHQEKLTRIFDTDEGARYVGEFSIGVNPFILHPMKDTLFDEKIAGSLHFTPGQSYESAPNGNSSAIHWDLVLIQRKEYGGGEIWLDGELFRKDGIFVDAELEAAFSAENLKGF